MEFTKLSSPSLKDLFVQQLQGMILSGALPVGTQLPPGAGAGRADAGEPHSGKQRPCRTVRPGVFGGPPPAGHLRGRLPPPGEFEHPHRHHAVQGRRAGKIGRAHV